MRQTHRTKQKDGSWIFYWIRRRPPDRLLLITIPGKYTPPLSYPPTPFPLSPAGLYPREALPDPSAPYDKLHGVVSALGVDVYHRPRQGRTGPRPGVLRKPEGLRHPLHPISKFHSNLPYMISPLFHELFLDLVGLRAGALDVLDHAVPFVIRALLLVPLQKAGRSS